MSFQVAPAATGPSALILDPTASSAGRAAASVALGYFRPIYAYGPNVIPSQDGDYWLFYDDGGKQCVDQSGDDGSSCYEQPAV
jgi:hypothetical protein